MLIPRKTLVPALLCALYFFFQPVLFAQKISIPVQLKTGRILFDDVPSAGIDPSSSVFRPFSFDGKLYLMLTFRSIPVQSVKDKLHDEGIELLEYIPENTFMASIRKAIPAKIFNQAGITGFQSLKSFFKIDPVLTGEWNSDPNKKFPVRISYQKDITPEIIEKTFRAAGFNATGNNSGFELVMNQEEMNQMALAPYITFIEPVAGDPVPLNDGSRVLLESVRLTSTTPGIGRGLSGRDVVIGLGDDGGIAHHPDFGGRLIPEGEYFNTNHATHVAGIMAGGGILNPLYRGHAANAKIIVNGFNGIISSTPLYYSKYGMVLTNNSYGLGPLNCNNYGNYSYISRSTDEQLKNLPEVMHVFAAGNDGWITCAPNAPGYRTIYAHHQVAKNVLTVTGTARDPDFHFYSVGPTRDGRLKPEITSIGFEVLSTILNAKLNSKYGYNYGSSMAAPQVTGILALLVERYRQLHGNTNPKGALLKAIVCNTAKDIGKKGPDFEFGFGWVNAEDAVRTLEKNEYYELTINQNDEKKSVVNIPAGTKRLKVLLYWPDNPSSIFTFKNLVNDLDLRVTDPSGSVQRPLVLDTSITGMVLPAVPGDDHINNIEQVVIENPLPGDYLISVKGFKVPYGQQPAFVVYQKESDSLEIRAPIGGEKFFSNTDQIIVWKETGLPANNHLIELSVDSGTSWQSYGIATGPYQQSTIKLPNVTAMDARIRITNQVNGKQVISQPFQIFPSIAFTVTDPCPGMIAIKWSKPAGVDTFIVTRLIGNDMIPVTTTTDSSFIQTNLSTDTAYWYAVQSIIKGIPSMRSGAKAVFPIGSNCFLSSYNGDLMLDSVSLPESGRQYTSSHRTANEPFSFFIHNRDDSLSAIPIFIKTYVNNVWYCTDTINSALPANVVTKITSKYTLDLSSPGVYTVVCTMENTGDPDTTHHTFSSRIRILANDPVTLPHLEDFSSAKDTSYGYPGYFGLEGAEHWDYETSYPNGKLHVNNNGGNSFVSLEKIPDPEYNQIVHSVKGTFNFVNIDTSVNIRMSAKVLANPDNNFYLFRLSGSDTSSSVYISGNATYVNISKVLRDAKQIPSSSLQVQFYWDSRKTQSEAPNFLDSIYFFSVNKDAAVEAVTLENSGIRKFMIDTFRYRVLIRNQTPNVTGAFTAVVQWPNGQQFSTPVLSLGKYAIDTSYFQIPAAAVTATNNAFKVWIELAGDEVRQNDTVTIAAPIITPLIDTFPYLQSFESGPAGWTGIGMLTLSDKPTIESSPVKAANGNFFWHPNNLPESPPLTTNLISPSFDLRKLNKPAISFSFAENLRKGIDSAFLEVSYNGGKSFTRLKPAYSINWHDYKNDSLWSDSLKKYWHVATALIPRNDTPVHFRIFVTRQANRFTYPLWPGGIGIDDIHIYDLSNPVASNTTLPVSGQITGAGNGWMEIIRDGKIFAAINMQGQDGGILDYDIVPATGLINYVQGYPLLKRKWVLHFSKKLVKPASVRLYFTDDEAEALLQTQLCNHTELSSAYDFSVIQYSGPLSTINGNLLDNISSSYSIIPSTKFNLIPFDKGYYAEVDVTGSSEYFVAANRADSVMTEIQISSVNKSQTLIQWTNTDTSVVRFELEVARDPVAAREGSFTLLKSLNAPAVTYEVIDTSTSGTNWYRLKVLYSSGCIGYSSIKWSGAAAGLVFRIYPNPSNTGLYTVLPSMPLPGTATWEVTNTIGQTIWRTQTTSAGNYDKVTIDLSSLAISKGIYHLRVSWPGGKQTIKLIRL